MHANYVFRGKEITLGKATKGVAVVLAVLSLIFVLNNVFRENTQHHHESQTALLKIQRDTIQGVEKLVKHLLEERLGQIMKFLEGMDYTAISSLLFSSLHFFSFFLYFISLPSLLPSPKIGEMKKDIFLSFINKTYLKCWITIG
jgi:hypothetical protein